jgi:N-acetylglucosaminyl-diphospho-decaprenol L-rhamnosyltransferase
MDLSIVILHHGRAEAVSESLEALRKAWLPEQTEVLVVNNGARGSNGMVPFSEDASMGPNLPFDLKFFEIKNKGYPQGNNFALKQAKGKFLCILTDVVVEKETFKVLLDYLKKNSGKNLKKGEKGVGLVAPRLIFESGEIQDNYRAFPGFFDQVVKRTFLSKFFLKRMRRHLMWDKDPHVSESVDWLTGAMQVFTRECWDAIGPKDERYFLFMSDVDICRTAWSKGFGVHFVGETQAVHGQARLSGGGIKDVFKKKVVRTHLMDAMKYYWKYRKKDFPELSPSGKQ